MVAYSRTYRIEFPREPSEEIKLRMRDAGMRYTKAPPILSRSGEAIHAAQRGTWEGKLTSKALTTINLPEETKIEQVP